MLKLFASAFKDEIFIKELKNYCYYAALIKLERLIAYSLAKYFKQKNISSVLEKDKHDIVVNGKSVELKFHFDFDILLYWKNEFKNFISLENILDDWEKNNRSKSWSVIHGLAKDIVVKKCDYFVWIISERDSESYLNLLQKQEDICLWNYQKKYNSNANKIVNVQSILENFSEGLKKQKKCNYFHETVSIDIPKTTLHFYIFKFN